MYIKIESDLYSKTVARKSKCLLLGFDSEVEEIDLGNGLKIRKISKDEIVELWRGSEWFRGLAELCPEFSFKPIKYVLERCLEAPKITYNEKYELEPADTKFEKVVSAMRLFKKGWIDYPFIIERATSVLASGTSYSKKRHDIPSGLFKISYKLTKEEAEDFKGFYKRIGKEMDCSKIFLKRFNETYRRVSIKEQTFEDKIIDYCIAFESLFCGSDTRQKGEIIAIEASMLLGRDNNEREEIRKYLIKAYRVRNDIIHSSLSIPDSLKKRKINDDIETFTYKVEDYLRRCIRKLI